MFITSVDVASDCPVSELLNIFDKLDATIYRFKAIGPAGGNPLFHLSFDTQEKCRKFVDEWYRGQGFSEGELARMVWSEEEFLK